MKKEIWKDVVGREGYYQISSRGRLKSLSSRHLRIKMMNPTLDVWGYHQTMLTNGGRRICIKIQRLVAQAFIPNPEGKPWVNHKNGVKGDNRLENLEWVTPAENMHHARLTGLYEPSKLTHDQVRMIRKNYDGSLGSQKRIAEKYGVTNIVIHNVVRYKTFRYI